MIAGKRGQGQRPLLLGAARTVFGCNRGALSSVRVDDLAALPLASLTSRHPGLAACVDDVVMGNTNGAGEDNRNVARMAALLAGMPETTPGVTVNRLCGSGGEAVVQASRAIRSGDLDCVVAGGVEGMSRAPFVLPKAEVSLPITQPIESTTVGWRMINPRFPGEWTKSLGACVEKTAASHDISRAEQDEWALRSHQLANDAWDKDWMEDVLPVGGATRDESIRADASIEALAALRPAFVEGGTLTAGNSSPINDGAAALLLGNEMVADRLGVATTTEVVSSSVIGVRPDQFAEAPARAVQRLLDRTGHTAEAIDVWEINEAFAAVVLAFLRDFPQIPHERVNAHGGAIAIGHPLGASMARVVADTAARLRLRGGGLGVAAACIGVGQGMALLIRSD